MKKLPNMSTEEASTLVRLRGEAKRMGWSLKRLYKHAFAVMQAEAGEDEVALAKREIERSAPPKGPIDPTKPFTSALKGMAKDRR